MDGKRVSQSDEITVSRARLDSITVYDVTEEELEIIERGSPGSTYLNFAVAFLTNFLAFLAILLVEKIEDDRIYMTFVAIDVISFVAGIVLTVMWLRTSNSSKTVFTKIRSRKNANKVKELAEESTASLAGADAGSRG